MPRIYKLGSVFAIAGLALICAAVLPSQGQPGPESEIRIGYEIAPVPLNLAGKNPALVGLGSYIVNSQSDCSACHTWHQFAHNPPGPGGNPFRDEPQVINTGAYLAGGRPFPPVPVTILDAQGNNLKRIVYSRNITPNAAGPRAGLPAGLTFDEFLLVMRTGKDFDAHVPPREFSHLQVMPWPVFQNMSDRDLRAIYEYLSAIPHAEPDFPPPEPLP